MAALGDENLAVAHGGIAKLWKPVVNVTDLDKGERFWSAVSGLRPQGRQGGQYSILDADDAAPGEPWMLLQLVPEDDLPAHGGTHLDFRVDDVSLAAQQIEDIGGTTLKPSAIYEADGSPVLEWAIMLDPFGNQFCIIRYPL
jgi:catechol 2,3-dioxygenase-like lactoylglutathione lyase family enzyme